MRTREGIGIRANLLLVYGDRLKGDVHMIYKHNLVVDAGLDLLRDLLCGDSSDVITHIAYGSDSTAAAAGQTELESQTGSRFAYDSVNKSAGQLVFDHYLDDGDGDMGDLKEAGLFTADVGGTMFCRATFSTIDKTATTWVQVYWTITFEDDGA
jgi:hypothetical protein